MSTVITRNKLSHSQEVALATITTEFTTLQNLVHQLNEHWWRDPATGQPIERNTGELIALIHAEISEALEGARKGKKDDHLPAFDNFTVELADAIIRILDLAGARNLPLGTAIWAKLQYNQIREDHTNAARLAEGGKKF